MIDNLTDQEKSVLLAKVQGWTWKLNPFNEIIDTYSLMDAAGKPVFNHALVFTAYRGKPRINLYDSANMALAWRVLNWVTNERGPWELAIAAGDFELEGWLFSNPIWRLPNAQRLWLDKILELAIEAKLIILEENK